MGKGKSDYCEGCDFQYNDTRRPHILGCGHSLCSCCVTLRIKFACLSCSFCTTNFSASSVSDIPINYSLENCISTLRKLRRPGLAPEEVLTEKSSHSVQELVDYQKQSAQDLVLSAKDLAEDLAKYHEFLNKNMKKHKEMRKMIQSRAEFHRTISGRMYMEQDAVVEAKKQLDALIEKLSGDLPKLDGACSNGEVAAAMTRVTKTYHELANCVDSCQEEYPHGEMPVFQRLLTRSMNVVYMEDFEDVKQDKYVLQCPIDDPSIMDKLNICRIEDLVTVDDLKSDLETWKDRIHRCTLAAVSWDHGRSRMTYLMKENDKIYLNCLFEFFPRWKYVIEYKEILTCMKSDPTVVFLELSWDHQMKGRVHIELDLDTPLARHFKGLCTGELGPTYQGKMLVEVMHPGSVTERITCEPCKGSFFSGDVSRETLGFNKDIYKREADQGIIWMDTSLSFSILTGVGRGCMYNNVFGQVTDGLDLLLDSVEMIKKGSSIVSISNSGVLLEI